MNEMSFFKDLALLMSLAGLVAVVCARFNLPKVIGYIFAGILLNRYTFGGTLVADEDTVQIIGNLGVVFLMFTMGLSFSATTIKKVGHVAFPTGFFDAAIMTWLGFTIARSVLGWGMVPSLFLGVAICDSATTMLSKMITELGWTKKRFVTNAISSSVCEDIVCVGMIALVTGVAKGAGMDVATVAKSLGSLGVFFAATLFFGLAFIPRFLTSISKRNDDEALLLAMLGCGFFVTYIAQKLDFSFALGAFLVGMIGSGSDLRERLQQMTNPLQTMFAAIFFLSVGLLVNPMACWQNMPAILLLSAVVMVGKFINCFIVSIAAGEDIKTSVQSAMALAQIGEFAFMVALLYVNLTGDTTKPMYQVVIGVSLLTTILNPFMLRASDPVGNFFEMHCPVKLRAVLDGYRGFLTEYRAAAQYKRVETRNIKRSLVALLFVGVLAVAVAIAFSALCGYNFAQHDFGRRFPFIDRYKGVFSLVVMNVIFIVFMTVVWRIALVLSRSVARVVSCDGRMRWQRMIYRTIRFSIITAVMVLAYALTMMINFTFFSQEPIDLLVIFLMFLAASFVGWRFFRKAGLRVKRGFERALKTDERLAKISREITFAVPEGHVVKIIVPKKSPAAGQSIGSLNIRAKTGAIIVEATSAGKRNRHIGADYVLNAGDEVMAIGEADQIAALRELLGVRA